MDINSLILKEIKMERSSATRLNTAFKILEVDTFTSIYDNEPFVAHLMLNKFKEFLDDDYFDDIERQVVLLKFLQLCYPIEISNEIVNFVQNECELKEDYERIILEWNLEYNDFIKESTLEKYDGQELALTKKEKRRRDRAINNLNKIGLDQLEDIMKGLGIEVRFENIQDSMEEGYDDGSEED